MKTLKFLVFLLFLPLTVVAQTYYSIQISARKNLQDAVKILEKVESYQDARIDKVNGFYKVRIGLFETYKDARDYMVTSGIKRQFKDAFISKVTDKILEDSIFPPEVTETRKGAEKPVEKKEKEVLIPKKNYSITIFEDKNLKKAVEFFKNLPEPVRQEAFIYKNENGTYSVRVFLEAGKEKINRKISEIKQYHFDTKIEQTERKNIVKVKIETIPKNTEKQEIEKKEEIKKSEESNKKLTQQKKTSKKEKEKSRFSLIFLLLGGVGVLSGVAVLLFKNRKEISEAKEMYQLLEEAIKKGDTSFVKEIVVPYLSRFPEDIKAQELYAMALEKEGRYMEAADLYFTIAEVLEGKQQFEEAMKYKKKAEELVNREFNKRRKQ